MQKKLIDWHEKLKIGNFKNEVGIQAKSTETRDMIISIAYLYDNIPNLECYNGQCQSRTMYAMPSYLLFQYFSLLLSFQVIIYNYTDHITCDCSIKVTALYEYIESAHVTLLVRVTLRLLQCQKKAITEVSLATLNPSNQEQRLMNEMVATPLKWIF